ncbi:MAG: serine hydroxymethyltransferase [Elusimicrobia bacterium]|nr:serine hydroxymethyltransferase [Elusimicrobiota bacterium]
MDCLRKEDPEILNLISEEAARQEDTIELIASENHTSQAVMQAQGSLLTNKYAEGYPGKRYYGGCEVVDKIEELAISRAKELFKAEHVNVQAHSGAQANMASFLALIKPGDTVMGMDLAHGGHLSHGSPYNFSGKYFNIVPYTVTKDTEVIDYDLLAKLAQEHKPKLIVTGASAYSRIWDWKKIQEIADSVGAFHMADIAHYAGLIAAGEYPSPIGYADIVTTTTHKTLRGPRGGMIMCKEKYAKAVNSAIFPGIQGGPLMHVIAAKAVSFKEALEPSFKEYQKQVKVNAALFAQEMQKGGVRVVSGGTDCHMFLVDLQKLNVNGKDAQIALERAGITTNKNTIPYDTQKPTITSGIRIGTPAITTRGMKEAEVKKIAGQIVEILKNINDEAVINKVKSEVAALCRQFPVY